MAEHEFFATCARGLEPVLHDEVRALRVRRIEQQVGGVRFAGALEDGWRANLWLRTAIRVLLRLARFACADQDELYRGVQQVDWRRFVRPDGSLAVDAQARETRLDHTMFIAQRTKDAIVDQLRAHAGVRPDVDRDDPDLRVHVHLWRDRATLSLDTSGESLHKRGWRRSQGRAPLAETLAAGIVALSGWDRRAPLLDPFCGSGTIVIEAAMLAGNVAPGLLRTFAFERWPGHDARAWTKLCEAARGAIALPRKLRIIGSDWEAERIAGARENAAAAGVAACIELDVADARKFAPRPGWNAFVVTNPPYGERVGDARELEATYRQFGERLRTSCGGYRVALLSGNPALRQALGLVGMESVELWNGGLECELVRGVV
jgi:23S rRNA G2445 N2-methylase RlmL